jgi:hypothetical protein
VIDLGDQRLQLARVGDGAVGDPGLVTGQSLSYGIEVGLGLQLIRAEIADRGLGLDQGRLDLVSGPLRRRQLIMLGQGLAAMQQLRQRAVQLLQGQQAQLGTLIGFDDVLPSVRRETRASRAYSTVPGNESAHRIVRCRCSYVSLDRRRQRRGATDRSLTFEDPA